MIERIKIIGPQVERIRDTGVPCSRIEAGELAAGLGAEALEHCSGLLDVISLGHLGNDLIQRLRSSSGRPGFAEPTQRDLVPLSPEDIANLTQIRGIIEARTGMKPSLGQLASAIIRTHLDTLQEAGQTERTSSATGELQA